MTSKEIKAFLACYVLFAAITVVLSKPANESDKEEKEILKGGLTCITRHRPSDDNITTKFFYVDEEQWPCFNGDGLNNCIQVSLFPEAKTSCLDCCQRLKGSDKTPKKKDKEISSGKVKDMNKNEEERKKTDGLRNGSKIGIDVIFIGCAGVFIFVWIIVGFASYYQPRQNNDAQNQQHPDLLPVQEMEEGHALQGRQYAGVQESIV